MDFASVHGYVIGFGVIGGWAIIAFWSLILRLRKRDEAPVFWRAVSVVQVLLAVQVLVGGVLLVMGRRPGDGGGGTLLFHLSYALFSPLVVLFFAHKWARDHRYDPSTIFAVAGLVIFGLTFRAWQVGVFGA